MRGPRLIHVKGRNGRLISTSIEELDVKLGGGVPFPSLILIEGGHGTGKSVLSNLIANASLREGLRVLFITTETTVGGLVDKASSSGFGMFRSSFLRGQLVIYSIHVAGAKWDKELSRKILRILSRFFASHEDRYDLVVIDSASLIFTYSSLDHMLDFMTFLKNEEERGKGFVMTIHPDAVDEAISLRLRAAADMYLRTSLVEFGGRTYKVIQVVKVHGTMTHHEYSIAFDVDPSIGFRVIPISLSTL